MTNYILKCERCAVMGTFILFSFCLGDKRSPINVTSTAKLNPNGNTTSAESDSLTSGYDNVCPDPRFAKPISN